jgi:hypothetical protein
MNSSNTQGCSKIVTGRAPPPPAVPSNVRPPPAAPAVGNVTLPQAWRYPPPQRLLDEFPRTLVSPPGQTMDLPHPVNTPAAVVHPISHYGRIKPGHKPTQWIFDDDDDRDINAVNIPGHAAYYESQTFRSKVARGEVQIPGRPRGFVREVVPTGEEKHMTRAKKIEKDQSLILTFGKANVRRANGTRKVDVRKQKRNQRA